MNPEQYRARSDVTENRTSFAGSLNARSDAPKSELQLRFFDLRAQQERLGFALESLQTRLEIVMRETTPQEAKGIGVRPPNSVHVLRELEHAVDETSTQAARVENWLERLAL